MKSDARTIRARAGAWRRGTGLLVALCAAMAAGGCMMGPDFRAISNRLREENMKQAGELSALRGQLANRDATIAALREEKAGAALQTLPADRLAQLFTASQIELRGQTDSNDTGDGKGVHGFRVFVRMHTAEGMVIPTTGDLVIEAFELPASPAEPRRIGTWAFGAEQMKKCWYSGMGLNHFALDCPWSEPPTMRDVTFKARFTDALTGQVLVTQLTRKISSTGQGTATQKS